MRITFVLNHVNLNGGIRVIAIYAERLKQLGHDVVVVARPRPVPSVKDRVKSLVKGKGWPVDPNTLASDDGSEQSRSAADLEAVFDVPVQVSAVLGRARMDVGELLKLGPGSVLELDR